MKRVDLEFHPDDHIVLALVLLFESVVGVTPERFLQNVSFEVMPLSGSDLPESHFFQFFCGIASDCFVGLVPIAVTSIGVCGNDSVAQIFEKFPELFICFAVQLLHFQRICNGCAVGKLTIYLPGLRLRHLFCENFNSSSRSFVCSQQ